MMLTLVCGCCGAGSLAADTPRLSWRDWPTLQAAHPAEVVLQAAVAPGETPLEGIGHVERIWLASSPGRDVDWRLLDWHAMPSPDRPTLSIDLVLKLLPLRGGTLPTPPVNVRFVQTLAAVEAEAPAASVAVRSGPAAQPSATPRPIKPLPADASAESTGGAALAALAAGLVVLLSSVGLTLGLRRGLPRTRGRSGGGDGDGLLLELQRALDAGDTTAAAAALRAAAGHCHQIDLRGATAVEVAATIDDADVAAALKHLDAARFAGDDGAWAEGVATAQRWLERRVASAKIEKPPVRGDRSRREDGATPGSDLAARPPRGAT